MSRAQDPLKGRGRYLLHVHPNQDPRHHPALQDANLEGVDLDPYQGARAPLRYVDLENAHLNPAHHDATLEGVDDANLEGDGPGPRRCPS